jgi:lipopolysaccharide/colanic/teichoic acid biosynthesis glycosyltransferase
MHSKDYILKRPFDFILSIIGIAITSPLWLLISIAIAIEDHGPVFFQQERCGKEGKPFNMIKFRSMKYIQPDEEKHKVMYLDNDPRITRTGRLLRSSAMDELPSLLNILKGEMSFVGPKPLPFKIDNKALMPYDNITEVPGYIKRVQVRPGLTGVAQIYSPKVLDHSIRFRYDSDYIDKMSLTLDIKLIFLSFWITFKGKWEHRDNKI